MGKGPTLFNGSWPASRTKNLPLLGLCLPLHGYNSGWYPRSWSTILILCYSILLHLHTAMALQSWMLVLVASLTYLAALVAYRLYFHPLRHFPGPKIAAITGWYECYHDLKRPRGMFMYKIRELHKIYGPVVRISPDEIHVHDSTWIDTVFVNPAQGARDKYGPAAAQAGTPDGVFGTALNNLHKRRRAALNPLFSKTCASLAEKMIYEKAELLLRRIDEQIIRDGCAEMRNAFLAFATDVVTHYCFGHSLGLLEDEAKSRDWFGCIRALGATIPVARQFNWIIPVSQMLPERVVRLLSPQMAMVTSMHTMMEKQARLAVKEHTEYEHNRDKSKTQSNRGPLERLALFRTVLQNHGLPAPEKAFNRISHEGVTIIAAGGETTASAFMAAMYFICSDKQNILPKLLMEIHSVMPTLDSQPSVAELERLPWLTAVIRETLRLTNLTARLTRVAPDEALRYQDWVMPPGTPVSMTLRDVAFDPTIFPNPYIFKPERWLPSNPDLQTCNRYFVPFSKGSRMCIGINLAYAELYIALAFVFRRKDFQLVDTIRERDVDFVRDFFVGETSPEGRGVHVKYAAS
ncbi:cytochrome P450 [Xylariaceae sp. FL1019]|nr:cytochrome P450 [Xylariaceae sp. FL1019]